MTLCKFYFWRNQNPNQTGMVIKYSCILLLSILLGILIFTESKTIDEDFGNLARYRNSSLQLASLPRGENLVVFMGDSITDWWPKRGNFFPGKKYVGRGIGGQTTPQMLLRFQQDVINLKPRVVVILAGTNDLNRETGNDCATIEGNLQKMVALSRANNIKVVLATILPVCGKKIKNRPPAKISEINAWIKDFCDRTGVIYLDYYSAMVGSDGFMRQDLADDCLHPNALGYEIMAPLAEKAIQQALQPPERIVM